MWRCRVFGHDFGFSADGTTMLWACSRDCSAGGSKEYATAAEAARYAKAFDKRTNDEIGKRAPLIGMFPLRLWHRLRNRRT